MCSKGTSSPHTAHTRWYLMRPWSLSWSWLNLRLFSSVAGYSPTGTVTRPKVMAPFHIVLGISQHLRGRRALWLASTILRAQAVRPALGRKACPRRSSRRACRWAVVSFEHGAGGLSPAVHRRRVPPDGRGRHPLRGRPGRADRGGDPADGSDRTTPQCLRRQAQPSPLSFIGHPGQRLRAGLCAAFGSNATAARSSGYDVAGRLLFARVAKAFRPAPGDRGGGIVPGLR